MAVHSHNYYSDNFHLVLDQTFHCLSLEAFSGLHYRMQTKWNATEKPHQLLVRGMRTDTRSWTHWSRTFNRKTPFILFACQAAAGEMGKKNIWHERLLVNNLQGHTEHVRPTKTIQLQAPRLPFSARAWSNPCFVLIGRRYRHQGENGSQDTHRASLKWIKLLGKSVVLEGGMER